MQYFILVSVVICIALAIVDMKLIQEYFEVEAKEHANLHKRVLDLENEIYDLSERVNVNENRAN